MHHLDDFKKRRAKNRPLTRGVNAPPSSPAFASRHRFEEVDILLLGQTQRDIYKTKELSGKDNKQLTIKLER
jgi:hypothetical protein